MSFPLPRSFVYRWDAEPGPPHIAPASAEMPSTVPPHRLTIRNAISLVQVIPRRTVGGNHRTLTFLVFSKNRIYIRLADSNSAPTYTKPPHKSPSNHPLGRLRELSEDPSRQLRDASKDSYFLYASLPSRLSFLLISLFRLCHLLVSEI